jgi:hypothetical protein
LQQNWPYAQSLSGFLTRGSSLTFALSSPAQKIAAFRSSPTLAKSYVELCMLLALQQALYSNA